MRRIHTLVLVGLVGFALISPIAVADDAAERVRLEAIENQLAAVEREVAAAAAKATTTRRIQFQYHWLMADLARIRAGIREYRVGALTEPRTVPPISGDYLR